MFFMRALWHLAVEQGLLNKDAMLMAILELVDITMIANLIKMIIVGSYTSFVNKSTRADSEHLSSGMLKVKMATSLVGVSSIHLLQAFINNANVSFNVIAKLLAIHMTFLVGALILAIIDHLHHRSINHHP